MGSLRKRRGPGPLGLGPFHFNEGPGLERALVLPPARERHPRRDQPRKTPIPRGQGLALRGRTSRPTHCTPAAPGGRGAAPTPPEAAHLHHHSSDAAARPGKRRGGGSQQGAASFAPALLRAGAGELHRRQAGTCEEQSGDILADSRWRAPGDVELVEYRIPATGTIPVMYCTRLSTFCGAIIGWMGPPLSDHTTYLRGPGCCPDPFHSQPRPTKGVRLFSTIRSKGPACRWTVPRRAACAYLPMILRGLIAIRLTSANHLAGEQWPAPESTSSGVEAEKHPVANHRHPKAASVGGQNVCGAGRRCGTHADEPESPSYCRPALLWGEAYTRRRVPAGRGVTVYARENAAAVSVMVTVVRPGGLT